MFSNQHYNLKKNMPQLTKQSNTYFLKLVHDENKRVDKLKKEEKLATAENPRIKFQEDTTEICEEIRICNFNKTLEQKRRQQLRANSHELRQLEKHLQLALVSKQLKEQQENLIHRQQEALRKQLEENAKFAAECELVHGAMLQQEEKEKQKKEAFRNALKSQIGELQQRRKMEIDEVVKDKNKMKELLKRMKAEEIADRREVELQRERYKKEMEESYRNRELQRQLENQRNVDDIEHNVAYLKECDDLKLKMAMERKRTLKEKEKLSEQIGHQLDTINHEKEKRKDLLLSLLVAERKAKEDQLHREMLIKQVKEREVFRMESEHYHREVQLQKQKQLKEDEEQFREEHLRYLAERDKLDQLSDEKRRRKKLEHSKALKELIEIRRTKKVDDVAQRIVDFEKMLNEEKERDQMVEDERIRMLSLAPKELLNYLPPGVLKSTDKEFLTLPGQMT